MKDYVEVDEKKCDEVHNCMCTKEVGEKNILSRMWKHSAQTGGVNQYEEIIYQPADARQIR